MLYQLSHFRPISTSSRPAPCDGAESQIRTGDTAIFSRVLYQLSYLGPKAPPGDIARRRAKRYHARAPSRKHHDPAPAPAAALA